VGWWEKACSTEDGGRFPNGGTAWFYLLGGCVLTGAKLKGTNEPVRFLNDALKPKLYVYERCADAYLRIPT